MRNEHFELWNGNFYDSERNFANLKIKNLSPSFSLDREKKKTIKNDIDPKNCNDYQELHSNTQKNTDEIEHEGDYKINIKKNDSKRPPEKSSYDHLWEGLMESEEELDEERWGGRTTEELRGIARKFEKEKL